MLIDSHTHLNFQAYDDDLAEVIDRCQQAEMALINVGAALDSSKKAVILANDHKNFYASIGLHPIHVFDEDFQEEDYQKLIDDNGDKIVAMGESGLDYFHFDQVESKYGVDFAAMQKKQKNIFERHIALAKKNNLALIVHGRNDKENKLSVYQDIHDILQEQKVERAVVHCFGGSLEESKLIVDLGLYLGFTGIVTFDKTGVLEEIVNMMPLDKILIETDAPYLTPVPFRGKRNEPIHVQHVAEKIAEIRKMSVEEVIKITGENAKKLFNLK
jgi:TatD DNase family protein